MKLRIKVAVAIVVAQAANFILSSGFENRLKYHSQKLFTLSNMLIFIFLIAHNIYINANCEYPSSLNTPQS